MKAVADLGEGRPPLFVDQIEARGAEKNSLETGRPPYLRVWMTSLPTPPPPILRSGSGTEKP